MKKDNQNIALLYDLLQALTHSLSLEDVVQQALEKSISILHAQAGEFYLLDKGSRILCLKSHRGLSPEYIGTGIYQWGEGVIGQIAEKNSLISIKDLSKDKHFRQSRLEVEGFVSYVGFPLSYEDEVLGVLGLYTNHSENFHKIDKKLLENIGKHIGHAVYQTLSFEESSLRARRFVAISRAISATRSIGTLNEVLHDICKVLVQSFSFDQAWIGLTDEQKNQIVGKTGFGHNMKQSMILQHFSMDLKEENPAIFAMQEQSPIVYQFIEDVNDGACKTWLLSMNVQSCAFIPVLSGDTALGVMGVFFLKDQEFQEEDIKALTSISNQTSIAIENARLYERIQKSEKQYRYLFNAIGAGLAILDERNRFIFVNSAFETLCGYSQKQLLKKRQFTDFFDKDSEQYPDLIDALHQMKSSLEISFIDHQDEIKHVFITITRQSETSDCIVTIMDMTQQKELERRLYQSEELAAIGELSAGIAHEIRNPLVAITNSVSLLEDEPQISEEGQQLLDIVKEESNHLAVIVEDFLKYARPKKPNLELIEINQFLRDIVNRYRDWDDNNVNWVEEYDADIPDVMIDHHQIQQVLTNLFLNGLDAMLNEGTFQIKTQLESQKRKKWIKICISDSGIGIEKEEIKKIFQPFYSTKDKGTGMGLAICRRILNQHGGEISVESQINKGTRFTLRFPIKNSV